MKVKESSKEQLLNTAFYTLETYFDFHPGASLKDFADYIKTSQITERLKRANRNPFLREPYTGIRRVVIDDAYTNWLNERNAKHNKLRLQEYMNLLSDEEVERLWSEHSLNGGITVEYIPVSLESDSIVNVGTISLCEDAVNQVYQYINQVRYNKKSLVFPQLVEAPFLDEDFENYFFEKAEEAFQLNRNVEFISIEGFYGYRQMDIALRFIPFVSLSSHKAVLTLEENSKNDSFDLSSEAASELSVYLCNKLTDFSNVFVFTDISDDPNSFEEEMLSNEVCPN
ncbi:hypothetical protein CN918_31050 [Priestia megaterium]|nr:hypothetical protein CN918_31050 [Priestia megaterium]